MTSIDCLPPTLVATQIFPYCSMFDLVNISTLSRDMRALVINLSVWRDLTEANFADKYRNLYARLPKSIPFFNILGVEVRFCSLEKKAKILDKYYEPCKLCVDITEDLTCTAVKLVIGDKCTINGVDYRFNKISEIIRAANAVIGI